MPEFRSAFADQPRRVALTLGLLLGLQPLATDAYLPALPVLAIDLQAAMGPAQLTLSALILAFGFGQLFWGPVADRVGRRPALLAGLALFTAASALCMAALSIGWLVAGRALQGFALAGSVVGGRAMLRDLYEPQVGARVMALALSGLGVAAVLGPSVGALLTQWWGWRANFAMLGGAGALLLLYVALAVPETIEQRNPRALQLRPLLAQSAQVWRHPVFRAWTLLGAATYGGLFTLLSAIPFAYSQTVGITTDAMGPLLGIGALSYLTGTLLCRRWLPRLGLAGVVRRACGFSLAGGLSAAALGWAEVHTVWAVLLPQCVFGIGHGLHQPCTQAGAVGPFPQAAGTASALSGFVLAVVAFGTGLWLGRVLVPGSTWAMGATVCAWSLVTAAIGLTWVQRHGQPGSVA